MGRREIRASILGYHVPTEVPFLLFTDIPVSQGPDPTLPYCLPSSLCRCKLSKEKEKDSETWKLRHKALLEDHHGGGCCAPGQALTMVDLGDASCSEIGTRGQWSAGQSI